jgi:hypothetical protein
MGTPQPSVDDLLAQYRTTLIEMDQCRIDQGRTPDRWNSLVNQMQRLHLQLRTTEQGRAGISALISDNNPTVRQWSAVNALAWDEATARAELQRQIASPHALPGLEAELALRAFDAGRLDTTWKPKS